MAKRLVSATLPIVGYIHASIEVDVPDSIKTEDEARAWIKENYTTHNFARQDSFDTYDVDYSIDTEDNDNLCILDVDLEEVEA